MSDSPAETVFIDDFDITFNEEHELEFSWNEDIEVSSNLGGYIGSVIQGHVVLFEDEDIEQLLEMLLDWKKQKRERLALHLQETRQLKQDIEQIEKNLETRLAQDAAS